MAAIFSHETMILKAGVTSRVISKLSCEQGSIVKIPLGLLLFISTAPALSVLICRKPYEQEEDAGCVTLYFRGTISD